MPYSFNPFSGNFDNTPSTFKGDEAYSTVQSNSSTNWDNEISKQYVHTNFLPLSGGTINGSLTATGEFQTGTGGSDFIITENGSVGIKTETPNEVLTVVGNVSATGNVVGSNLSVSNWNSTYSTVQSNSSTNWDITYYNVPFRHFSFGPVALSNYYIVDYPDVAPILITTTPIRAVVAPATGEFVAVTRSFTNTTTNGTSEGSTMYLTNITRSLSSLISNDVKTGDGTTIGRVLHNYWTLSTPLSVNAGDLIAIRWDCPNWVTAPGGSRQTFNTILKTRITI